MTLKDFPAMVTQIKNICAKFATIPVVSRSRTHYNTMENHMLIRHNEINLAAVEAAIVET